MDSSVSPKNEIWFLRVCHHISTGLYHWIFRNVNLYMSRYFIYETSLVTSCLVAHHVTHPSDKPYESRSSDGK